ncbi:MAG: hemerythrin domain-containing protein [Candidatus Contendobacter sp.]|nr:hemerythrin domain-containing protein [Candidatus Contendobacter sp.]
MTTLTQFLVDDHHRCDACFAAAEEKAQTGDPAGCHQRFQQFRAAMEHHFRQEETVLFPAFEQATGNTLGPTRVMRLEHQQMRQTWSEMEQTLAGGDLDEFLGQAETLLILMQQHNIKEEQMLYPMCDRVLGAIADSVIQDMRDLPADQPT